MSVSLSPLYTPPKVQGQGHGQGQIRLIIMDKDTDKDFLDFWEAYRPDELRFPNRKQATYREWCKRLPATQHAMLNYVKEKGAPKWKNPYFFVQDFPETSPTDWNGKRAPEETEIACWNGHWGMYTLTDIRTFKLQTKKQQAHINYQGESTTKNQPDNES